MGTGDVIDARGVCCRVVSGGGWVGYLMCQVFRAAVVPVP